MLCCLRRNAKDKYSTLVDKPVFAGTEIKRQDTDERHSASCYGKKMNETTLAVLKHELTAVKSDTIPYLVDALYKWGCLEINETTDYAQRNKIIVKSNHRSGKLWRLA